MYHTLNKDRINCFPLALSEVVQKRYLSAITPSSLSTRSKRMANQNTYQDFSIMTTFMVES